MSCKDRSAFFVGVCAYIRRSAGENAGVEHFETDARIARKVQRDHLLSNCRRVFFLSPADKLRHFTSAASNRLVSADMMPVKH
jgi:hypothetical protein